MKKDVEIEEYVIPILKESPCRKCHKVLCNTLCESGDRIIQRIEEIERQREEQEDALRILCA